MISDTLSDAVGEIKRYLYEKPFTNSYQGPIRVRIENLVKEMEAVRIYLDTPHDMRDEDR